MLTALWALSGLSSWPVVSSRADAQESASRADGYFEICVVDGKTQWPAPLVQLTTTDHRCFVTDNAGMIAIDDPDLMNREVYFFVEGHGYEAPADGFGYRGVRVTPRRGESTRVELRRTIIAKRVGRLTGAGLFDHSQRLGRELDWRESGVVGSDSVQSTVYRGKRFWLWGDTTLYHYPLGVFHSTSATTPVSPWEPAMKPPLRVPFDYVRELKRSRPRGVAVMPGSGPTWLSGYTVLSDQHGKERLVALYAKIKPPLEVYEWGLCVWDDETASFQRLKVLWNRHQGDSSQPSSRPSKAPRLLPNGHPCFWEDADGREWVLFGDPFPTMRCLATFEAWQDPAAWEALLPQKELRAAVGLSEKGQKGQKDVQQVKPHSGSVVWSPWRKRWVTVFMEAFGKPSAFGEIWYAEADSPTGPWGQAVKILSHNNYTFYNPKIHVGLVPDESPVLYFEGTYTQQFANKPRPTPRYDYNQILYRLDLDDERLAPAKK